MQSNPAEGESSAPCHGCGGAMEQIGTERFRVGGTSGIWKLFIGEWAELGEDMLPLEVWVCPSCRRVELRVPPGYRNPQERARGLRFARPNCGGDAYQGQVTCSACGYRLPQVPKTEGE